jgi:hypothetical protein
MAHVLIVYRSNCEPDASLARTLMERLVHDPAITVVATLPLEAEPSSDDGDEEAIAEATLVVILRAVEAASHERLQRAFRLAEHARKPILHVRIRRPGDPIRLFSSIHPDFRWQNESDSPRLVQRIRKELFRDTDLAGIPDSPEDDAVPLPRGPPPTYPPVSGKPSAPGGLPHGGKPPAPGTRPISFGHPAPPIIGVPPSGPLSPQATPEPVLVGLSAPKSARPGTELVVRFVASLKAFEAEVQKQLEGLGSPPVTLVNRGCRWKPGTQVQVRLSGTHLTCEPSDQLFEWDGRYQLLDFAVAVDKSAAPGSTVLKCDVLLEGVRVAFLTLPLAITAAVAPAAAEPPPHQQTFTEPARTAFASYSSRDRDRVIDMCAVLRNIADLDVFVDFDSLRAGKPWEEQLRQEIERRALFILFWSANARASTEVEKEWRLALALKQQEALQIQPLELGADIPPELRHLHFGDRLMARRELEALEKNPKPS